MPASSNESYHPLGSREHAGLIITVEEGILAQVVEECAYSLLADHGPTEVPARDLARIVLARLRRLPCLDTVGDDGGTEV